MNVQVKQHIRQKLLREREEATHAELSGVDALISDVVRTLPEFASAQVLFSYLSFGREVDTLGLITEAWRRGMHVVVPRVEGPGELAWHAIESFDGLVRSSMGMLEPPADAKTKQELGIEANARAVALVPGLAFDDAGYRIGYGGGYYDRFLPRFHKQGGVSIGLCRAQAFQPNPLPHEPFDAPVEIVVTDKGVHKPFEGRSSTP